MNTRQTLSIVEQSLLISWCEDVFLSLFVLPDVNKHKVLLQSVNTWPGSAVRQRWISPFNPFIQKHQTIWRSGQSIISRLELFHYLHHLFPWKRRQMEHEAEIFLWKIADLWSQALKPSGHLGYMPRLNAERTAVLLLHYCLWCLWLSSAQCLFEDSLKTNVSLPAEVCWLGQRGEKIVPRCQLPAQTWLLYFCTGASVRAEGLVCGWQLLTFANTVIQTHQHTGFFQCQEQAAHVRRPVTSCWIWTTDSTPGSSLTYSRLTQILSYCTSELWKDEF